MFLIKQWFSFLTFQLIPQIACKTIMWATGILLIVVMKFFADIWQMLDHAVQFTCALHFAISAQCEACLYDVRTWSQSWNVALSWNSQIAIDSNLRWEKNELQRCKTGNCLTLLRSVRRGNHFRSHTSTVWVTDITIESLDSLDWKLKRKSCREFTDKLSSELQPRPVTALSRE